jgi:hypothetical protein
LREIVARESGGTLDFYLQVQFVANALGGNFGISRVFADPFSADPSDLVGTYTGASLFSGVATGTPTSAVSDKTQLNGGGFGGNGKCQVLTNDCITFDFNSPYAALTKVLVISTNDTLFSAITKGDAGADMGLNGSSVPFGLDTFYGFAPLGSPVPEPVSIVLTGTTLAISALFIRRRRRAAKNDLSVS